MTETALQTIEQKVITLPQQAAAVVVADQSSLDAAGRFLKDVIVPLRKEITDSYRNIKRKADEAKQAILDEEKKYLAPVADAERIVRAKMGTYYEQKEREEAAERRRLDAIAQAKAEADRKAQIQLEKDLGASRAEIKAIKAEPLYVPPVVVASTVVKPSGIRIPKTWQVEVYDKPSFLDYLAAHHDLAYLADVNVQFVKGLAVSQKADPGFPGIKCEQKIGGR